MTATKERARLVYGCSDFVAAWVCDRISDVSELRNAVAIGVAIGDRLIAGWVFNKYFPEFGTIQLTVAADSPMWARKELIKELLSYPFIQLGAFKVGICMASDNTRILKTAKHVGFRQEGILAHQFGKGRHCVVSRMFRPEFERMYLEQGGSE